MLYSRNFDAQVEIAAAPEVIFARLDDQALLGAHMEKPSLMTMGMRMHFELDSQQGRAVGSVIGLSGKMLGIALHVDEIVTERDPPRRKVWETRGRPRLLVIDAYRMGFEIAPAAHRTTLRVFIDYALPPSGVGKLLGIVFGAVYARWCVQRMLDDAARHFAPTARDR